MPPHERHPASQLVVSLACRPLLAHSRHSASQVMHPAGALPCCAFACWLTDTVVTSKPATTATTNLMAFSLPTPARGGSDREFMGFSTIASHEPRPAPAPNVGSRINDR